MRVVRAVLILIVLSIIKFVLYLVRIIISLLEISTILVKVIRDTLASFCSISEEELIKRLVKWQSK